MNDTIAAIATPIGEAGIGIIRISGKKALAAADKVFKPKDGKKPSTYQAYTAHYGWAVEKNKVIDEVLLTVMRAPRSYTKEDVVEISCHGGIVAMRSVLDLVLENGCRLAEPGEFTKRAFLNGRLDLSQAEAVLDIIRAKTDAALKVGIQQLRSVLSGRINKIRSGLLNALAILEANIDFPDEEIGPVDLNSLKRQLNKAHDNLEGILANSRQGQVIREGIHVVICGKPNVGKSSLLNALLKKERSIVTPIAGTTRDTIEEIIDIKGIPVRIVDTAGIIEPKGLIEKKAVQRSKRYMESADLALLIFDGNKKLGSQDKGLIRKLNKKQAMAIINKIDLRQKIDKDTLKQRFKHIIELSAKKSKNINLLENAIADFVYEGKISGPEHIVVANARHIQALKEARKFIKSASNSLEAGAPIELVSQDIKDSLGCLDDILGKRFQKDLLDRIFNEFCIGK